MLILRIGEYAEQLELCYSVGGSINRHNQLIRSLRETFLKYLPMLNIDIPYDPAIPFLTIYLTEMYTEIHQKTYPSMLIEVPFIVIYNWKSLECPSITEWIINLWYKYAKKYYRVVRIKELFLPRIIWT